MAFALSGSTITQTGTDAGLSGLSGISGVTVNTYSDLTEYVLNTRSVAVNGTLTLKNNERLAFLGGNTNGVKVNSGGVFNFGEPVTLTTGAGVVTELYPGKHSLDIGKPTGTPWQEAQQGIVVQSGGTFRIYGGVIDSTKAVNIKSGATFYVRSGVMRFTSSLTYQNFYIDAADTDVFGLDVIDAGTVSTLNVGISTQYTQFEGFNPTNCLRAVCDIENDEIGVVSVEKYQGGDKNLMDVRMRSTTTSSGYKMYEANVGNGLHVEGFGSGRSIGFAEHWIRWNPTFKDSTTKALLDGVQVSIMDTDSGNRRSPFNDSDQTYSDTSDATGRFVSGTVDVLTGVWHNNGNNSATAYTLDDRLPVSGSAVKYGCAITPITLADSTIGMNDADVLMPADSSITETNKATVDAYTDCPTAAEVYDAGMAYIVDNFSGQVAPYVTRNGDELNFGAMDVDIRSFWGDTFSVSGNTVRIKSNELTANLTTTGTVTIIASVVVGVITDSTGVTTNNTLTVSGLVPGVEVRAYDTATGNYVGGIESLPTGDFLGIGVSVPSVDVVVHALGYLNMHFPNVDTSTNATLPVTLIADRQYENPT